MEARHAWTPTVYFHPGEMLDEKLDEMGISIENFSKETSIPASVLWDVTHGDKPVTADMALAFEKVTRIPARIWLKRQEGFDDYIGKKAKSSYMERVERFYEQSSSYICAEPQNEK